MSADMAIHSRVVIVFPSLQVFIEFPIELELW